LIYPPSKSFFIETKKIFYGMAPPLGLLHIARVLEDDYDVVSNKKITQRPLIDEVRQIPDSNLYIGKMYYRLVGKHVLFLWFAIELENYVT